MPAGDTGTAMCLDVIGNPARQRANRRYPQDIGMHLSAFEPNEGRDNSAVSVFNADVPRSE